MRSKRHLPEFPGSFFHSTPLGGQELTLLAGPHLFTEGEQISPKPTLLSLPQKFPAAGTILPLFRLPLLQYIFVFSALFTRTTLTEAEKAQYQEKINLYCTMISVLVFWCPESFSALSVLNADLFAVRMRKHTQAGPVLLLFQKSEWKLRARILISLGRKDVLLNTHYLRVWIIPGGICFHPDHWWRSLKISTRN